MPRLRQEGSALTPDAPLSADAAQVLLLLNWMSPTFPIGSFAYSNGTEQAIADGRLKTAAEVTQWIRDLLERGSGWNDAVLFSLCWSGDIDDLNATALALAGSAERYLETTQLGRAFGIAAAVWSGAAKSDAAIAYPIAAGKACRDFGLPRDMALIAFLQGFAAALVSVSVRLVPLGQTHGLAVLRALSPVIAEVARKAASATQDDLGSSTVLSDIAAMQHEQLEPRIFRT
jgi:urease accessory protein